MKTEKNLIMGLWSGSPLAGLGPFLGSLRHTNFHGDVCMFIGDVAPELIATLLKHDVLVERLDRLVKPRMHEQSSRFFSYLDFLARHGEAYDNVMIADPRDLVFQSDPFGKPLPADIVFALERCPLGRSAANHTCLAAIYGEAVAQHLRDCLVSCSGTTLGTVSGMLRYLVAMSVELAALAGHGSLMSPGTDQGIHNYLVHMRPLRNAWCDPTDSIVATMSHVPESAIQITERGVLIDGRLTPVIQQWNSHQALIDHIGSSPQFKLDATQATSRPKPRPSANTAEPQPVRQQDAVVAFYHRPRDAEWLMPFLHSLRCAGYAANLHCVGVFDEAELALLSQYGCIAHPIEAADSSLDVTNIAHFFISRVLDEFAADTETQPDQVLVLDTVRAAFLRDPFQARTIGLSAFQETATRIGDDQYNLLRLARFTAPEPDALRRPIISSSLLRGKLDIVRAFYRKLFIEFVGRAELMRIPKMIQGAVNKLCHGDNLDAPVILHTNGAEAYFEIWEKGLPATLEPPIRVAGAVPFVILNPERETDLMRAVRASLGIQ